MPESQRIKGCDFERSPVSGRSFFSMPKNLRVIKADPGMRPDAIQNKGGNEKVNKEELKKVILNCIILSWQTGKQGRTMR
ncbi:MAG: hypothetical protein ACLR09_10550 [Gallintestinimicrobium sp.]